MKARVLSSRDFTPMATAHWGWAPTARRIRFEDALSSHRMDWSCHLKSYVYECYVVGSISAAAARIHLIAIEAWLPTVKPCWQ